MILIFHKNITKPSACYIAQLFAVQYIKISTFIKDKL